MIPIASKTINFSLCLYILLKSHPSVCPSVRHANNSPGTTYQLLITINPSFVTTSLCGDQLAAWRRRSEESSSKISLETTEQTAQPIVQLTLKRVQIQVVNRFFSENQTVCIHIFKIVTRSDKKGLIAHDRKCNFFTQIQSYMNALLDFSVRHGLW